MVLDGTVGATCIQITSLDAVQAATTAHTMRQSWLPSVLCGWSTDMGLFHRPLLKALTCHRYIMPNICSTPLICPSSFPLAYNAITFKSLKSFNRSTYLSEGNGWTLQKMLQTQLLPAESKQRAQRQPSWVPITDTNKSLTLQPLSMHILYPGANEHSPLRVLHFFFFPAV